MQFFIKTCVILVAIGLAHARPGHGGYNFGASGNFGNGPALSGQVNHQFDNGVGVEVHGQSYDGGHHNAVGGSVGYTHEIGQNLNVYGQVGVDRGYGGKTEQNYHIGIEKKF